MTEPRVSKVSAYILNLEEVKKQVDTSKSFSSLMWLQWAAFGHFSLMSAKKEVPAHYIIITLPIRKEDKQTNKKKAKQ